MYCRFNETIDNWKENAEQVLCEKKGVLHLIDAETLLPVEMEILFMYTQLLYNGYYSDGIAKVGDDIGLIHVFLGPRKETYASFKPANELYDIELYDRVANRIREEGEEMVRNSEALEI